MVNSAFIFSGRTVIRNGALIVIDCSGCLLLNQAISMSNEHLFLLKGTEYRLTPNWRDVISQLSMK